MNFKITVIFVILLTMLSSCGAVNTAETEEEKKIKEMKEMKRIEEINETEEPDTDEQTDDYISRLYNKKSAYIGDVSEINDILSCIPYAKNINFIETELNTSQQPYGITLYYDNENVSDFDFRNTAAIMFALIQNCSAVNFKKRAANENKIFSRSQIDELFGAPVSSYAESFDIFFDFVSDMSKPKLYHYEEEPPLGEAIISQNKDNYLDSECYAEGHIILDSEEKDGNKIFYLLSSYGGYGFINGNFEKISGSGVIPVRITFDEQNNLVEYKIPMDGSYYEKSIHEIFPKRLIDAVLKDHYDDGSYSVLAEQEAEYAKTYISSISHKKCEIVTKSDKIIPEDINDDVSNELLRLFDEYPYWIGNIERVENGVRYVYEHNWIGTDGGDGVVSYKKYEYHSGNTVNETVIEIKGGKMKYIKGEPQK